MPEKIARLAPRPLFGQPQRDGGCQNLTSVLRDGRKTENIQAS